MCGTILSLSVETEQYFLLDKPIFSEKPMFHSQLTRVYIHVYNYDLKNW